MIFKRWQVRSSRIEGISDESIWSYSDGEKPFFNSELYEPEYTLENLICSYKRKYKMFGNKSVAKILIKLNDLSVSSGLYDEKGKNKLIRELGGELSKDIGRESVRLFIKKCKDF